MIELLRTRIARAVPRDLPRHDYRRAGVLVPVFEREHTPFLLLTKRTDTVEHHKGQISFPGGRQEIDDPDLLTTALRETYEEIGLDPARVQVWGRLDEIDTVVSGFAITPYVGLIPPPQDLNLNPFEIAELVAVPLAAFLDPSNLRTETRMRGGQSHEIYYYTYPPHVIWGATARIIKGMAALLAPPAEDAP
jgi:8-oxo-dGTP pyrophosphatase MutT (NUDIX family)